MTMQQQIKRTGPKCAHCAETKEKDEQFRDCKDCGKPICDRPTHKKACTICPKQVIIILEQLREKDRIRREKAKHETPQH